jgi:hypothetical protein
MTINCNNKENKLKRKEGKGSRALYTRGWPEARLSNASKPKLDHARAVTLIEKFRRKRKQEGEKRRKVIHIRAQS